MKNKIKSISLRVIYRAGELQTALSTCRVHARARFSPRQQRLSHFGASQGIHHQLYFLYEDYRTLKAGDSFMKAANNHWFYDDLMMC